MKLDQVKPIEIRTSLIFESACIENLQSMMETEQENIKNELNNEKKTLKRLPEAYRDKTRLREL